MSSRAPLLLLSCSAARPMAQAVASHIGAELVPSHEAWFACGEGKFVLDAPVRGSDLYVFQSALAPDDDRSVYDRFVMLLHAVEAAALSDAEFVTAVLPYYPGARQDKRKGGSREGISAGLFARMLQEAGASRVVCIEIHNEAIAGMFDPPRCRLENIRLHQRFAPWLRRRGLQVSTVASPDVGGLERARFFAAELSADLVALSKERDYSKVNSVVRSTLIGDVQGKDVLLVDDIVDTAGSVVAAVDELKHHGAGDVTVACAHPVFSPPAWDRLHALRARAEAEGWCFEVVGTSCVHHTHTPDWYAEFLVSPLLAEVIVGINTRGSIELAVRGTPSTSD